MRLIKSKLGPVVSPTTKYPWYHSIRSLTHSSLAALAQSSFAHHPKLFKLYHSTMTSAFIRAVSPGLTTIASAIQTSSGTDRDVAAQDRQTGIMQASTVNDLIELIPSDYRAALTDPLHALVQLVIKLESCRATNESLHKHQVAGTFPAFLKGTPPKVQHSKEFAETAEARACKNALDAAHVTWLQATLAATIKGKADELQALTREIAPEQLWPNLRSIVLARSLIVIPLMRLPVLSTNDRGEEYVSDWADSPASIKVRDSVLEDCGIYAARVIGLTNVTQASRANKFKKRKDLATAARTAAGDVDVDMASSSTASVQSLVDKAVARALAAHDKKAPSRGKGAQSSRKSPTSGGNRGKGKKSADIEKAKVGPSHASFLAVADFFLGQLRQGHRQTPGQQAPVRASTLQSVALPQLTLIRDQKREGSERRWSTQGLLTKGKERQRERKARGSAQLDTRRSAATDSSIVYVGPSMTGGSSRDVFLSSEILESMRPGCFITEGDLWVSDPSKIPDELLDLPFRTAIGEILSRMSLDMISTLSYQQDVHTSPGVHLPKEMAFQISVGAKYMFHEPSNTDLFRKSWLDFNRRLRWRLTYLFEKTGETPYDPDYDVRTPSTKMAPALPLYIELGLVKGRRFVNSTIAKVPDVETLRHPHRTLQPDVGSIRKFLLEHSYVITGTDKNLGTAVSHRDWIIEKSQDILSDVNSYRRLEHDEAVQILNTKCKHMESLAAHAHAYIDHLEGTVADFMRSKITLRGEEHHIPQFYGIPKIHKQPVKMRPIIPCHSAIMNPAAKYVSKKLKPLIQAAPTIIHGTKDLAQKLSKLTIDTRRRWYIVTGDVVAYYPNIPLERCLQIVYDMYFEYYWNVRDHDSISNRMQQIFFKDCLQVGNTNLLTQFQNNIYEQLNGLAMGVACSPDLANLFGAYFEQLHKVLDHDDIFYYGRYIDDCLAIVYAESEEHATNILSGLVKFDNCVITWDCSDSHQPFLDMMLYKDADNTLQHMPYRKNGNHQERIPWISSHPYDVKRGTFLGEMSRLATLSSTLDSYLGAMRGLVALYIRRGYPAADVHKWLYSNLSRRWEQRLEESSSIDGAEILVLKTQYNIAWNYFNAHDLGDTILNYWREWLERADRGDFNPEFPAPDSRDARVAALASGAAVEWDLRKTNIFNSKVILSRKRTRNFLDISNLWKRTVITGIEGQALDDNLRLYRQDLVEKRPFVPDVNTEVVGRRTKIQRVDQEDDVSHYPVHRRYPSPTPGPSTWQAASLGTWGRGGRP